MKFAPQAPLADIFVRETDCHMMTVSHDDLYTQSSNKKVGPNPFEENLKEYSQDTVETVYAAIEIPEEKNHPTPEISKIDGKTQ